MLQNATSAETQSMQQQANTANVGNQMQAVQSAQVQNVMSGLVEMEKAENKVMDVNTMMTAFEDYVDKVSSGGTDVLGVPITYYIKNITKSQLAQLWVLKYYPQYLTTGTNDQVDIEMTVVEKNTGNLLAGVGYSSTEGLVFNASVSQQNIFGSGNALTLALNTSRINRTISLMYTEPYWTVDGVSRTWELYQKNIDPTGYTVSQYSSSTFGVALGFGVPVSEIDTINYGFRYEHTNLSLFDNSPPVYYQYVQDFGYSTNSYILSGGWSRDTRNDILYPSFGRLQSALVEVGLPFEKNHRDQTLQPSPLNLSRMFWSWNAGYKFLRLDIKTTGQPRGWMVHLGSTGCEPAAAPSTIPVSCSHRNTVTVELPGFSAARDVVERRGRRDRDAVVAALAEHRDLVAGGGQHPGGERGVLDLDLLQAQHVGAVLREPLGQPALAGADRVDVPGRDLHVRTYMALRGRKVTGPAGIRASAVELDPRTSSHVEIDMKAHNDLSLWSIIERLQRRLERQGMTPATADRALSLALRELATR